MASIIELRKKRFIAEFGREDYEHLLTAIERKPHLFDNEFFSRCTEAARLSRNVMGFLYLSHFCIALDRLIEAEYCLTKAYETDEKNNLIQYALVDIFSRRRCLHHAWHFTDALEASGDDVLAWKAGVKFNLMAGDNTELCKLVVNSESYVDDHEAVALVLESAIRLDDFRLTNAALRSRTARPALETYNVRQQRIILRHVRTALVTTVKAIGDLCSK